MDTLKIRGKQFSNKEALDFAKADVYQRGIKLFKRVGDIDMSNIELKKELDLLSAYSSVVLIAEKVIEDIE